MENAWQDFGQQVSLTSRIRELLLNYPEGTSIFKELIQNADDARATTISLCLDYRHHGTTSLAFQELAPFQGPALLVYNNATFSETDFDSIRHIGDSVKRGQVAKTGRYGLGFTSCYHLTEIPTFVSGKYLCMFDPAAKFLPGASAGNPGKRIDFVSAKFASTFPDSAVALKSFGCDMETPFNGTLFRFALRTEQMAAISGISKQVYAPERLHQLLKDLQTEAHLILIFLKSVESIQICEWLPGQEQPETIFTCGLKNPTPALRIERSMYTRVAQAVASLSPNTSTNSTQSSSSSSSSSSLATLCSSLQNDKQPLVYSNYVLEIESSLLGTTRYLIGQACSTVHTPAWNLAVIVSKELGTNLVPWAAVALPLPTAAAEKEKADKGALEQQQEGRVFCFLPLPASSGMPAHINGTFELSSNRRDIWHGASDLLGVGKQRAAWNAVLLADIAAPLYAQVLSIAATQLGPTEAYFKLFPGSIEALRARDTVAALVDPWLKNISTAAVAYTNAHGGRWIAPKDAIFLDDRASKDTDLAAALLQLNMPITSSTMPTNLTRMFVKDALSQPQILLPVILRQHLKKISAVSSKNTTTAANQQLLHGISPLFAAALLDFVSSDILEDDVESVGDLLGVKLLPLLDGSLGSLVDSGDINSILFVPRGEYEVELFQKAGKKMVDVSVLRSETLQKLSVMGRLQFFNLRLIDATLASQQLMQFVLPSTYKGKRRIEWVSNGEEQLRVPSKEWIQMLWQWLRTQTQAQSGKTLSPSFSSVVRALAEWSVIPTTSGYLLAPEPLQTSILVNFLPQSSDASLLLALNKLGCEVIDDALCSLATSNAGGGGGGVGSENYLFAHPADGPGVLQAMLNSYKQSGKSVTMEQWFASLLPTERDQIRTFLLQPRWFASQQQQKNSATSKGRFFDEELIRFLTEIPIYPRAASLSQSSAEEKEESNKLSLFTDLQSQQRYLIPHEMHAVLTSCEAVLRHPSLLKSCGREADGVILDHLGVKQLTKAQFYKKIVLPVLPQLPLAMAQSISIQLLREVPVLHQADPTLIPLLRSTPLVTTADGTKVTVPSQLYDPRNGDLMLLLDPGKNFPAGEYGPVLDQLKMLGMRTTAGRDTVLQAARDIAASVLDTSETSEKEKKKAFFEAAASRGRALLAYVDMEASRLNKPTPATSSSNTLATGDDGVGFNLDSVFSKVASFLGGDNNTGGGSGGSPAAKSGSKSSTNTAATAVASNNEKNEKEVEEFWQELKSLPWCPVQNSPPVPGLPWRTAPASNTAAAARLVAAPKDMRLRAETWLVCSQFLIIDGEPRSPVLLSKMGWNVPLDCEVLARHLAALGTAFTPPIGGGASGSSSTSSSTVHQEDKEEGSEGDVNKINNLSSGTALSSSSLRQQLAEIVPQLYRTLATFPPRNLTKVRNILGNTTPCIWIGDGFAPVGKVAMKGPLNLTSAGVYVIPLELAPFKELLLHLGIPASFSAEQYIGVLAAMHAERSKSANANEKMKTKPLSATQLEQALAIATALADMHIPASTPLYLPDEHAVLRSTSELMYNDAPWTSHSLAGGGGGGAAGAGGAAKTSSSSPEDSSYFIHPVISNDVAERLGVTSLQRCLLVHNADAFPMALTGAAVEAFGQSEALTTRLRHILEAYPDGSGVLMELLQNADDAGATTARFLLDRSEWGTDRVMGSRMASWQGPALMAWNDAVFSPSDVQNIARIGQDTKLSRPDATGRFGLGFNSVFHFSDLPSFVSGDLLVMFDPHASWLPGVTLAQPGIKIRFPSSPLIKHFPDSFQPYQVFGCNMHETYNGTLFRFPLRTEDLAPLSEIKPQAYKSEDVLNLFENFKSQAAHSLLFLKSLKLVELWVRDNAESEPRKMFSAELEPIATEGKDASTAIVAVQPQHPQAAIKAFVRQGGGKDAFYQRLKATKDSDLPSTCTMVDVKLQNNQEIKLEQRWLICNLLAGGRAKQLALTGSATSNNAATPRGWVPWTGVAAPIHLAKSAEPFQGRGFCFLPLPALTQLPLHINGLFELSSNRRDLWHGQDLSSGAGKIRADWNSALLADGAAVAYVRLLVAATNIKNLDLVAFYALWPQKVNVPEPWNEVVDAFYLLLIDQPVVWSAAEGGTWVAPSFSIFSKSASSSSKDKQSLESRMASMLLNEGLPVLDGRIPDILVENLLKYHPQLAENNILSPAFLRRHLGEKGRLPASVENEAGAHAACLQYCLRDLPSEGLQDLMGVPLLPLADGSLGFFVSATTGVRPLLLPVAAEADCVDSFTSKLAGRLIALDSSTTEHHEEEQTLREQLVALAASGRVNLRVLDAAGIAEEVLPMYLPASWQNQLCVGIKESSIEIEDISIEWVLKLWKVVGAASENNTIKGSTASNGGGFSDSFITGLEALAKWPLIPAEKQKCPVFAAPTPSAGLLEEGAFTEAAMTALSKLGCAFVSLHVSKQLPEMVRNQCIHPATGLGVLTALLHVFKAKTSITPGASSEESPTEMLLDEEKDALRTFLLQPRWFESASSLDTELATQLLSLPIYRCCTRGGSNSNPAASPSPTSVMFTDIESGEKYLVPDGFNEYAALSSDFIYSSSPGEAHVLVKVLGVKPISLEDLMIHHAVPAAPEILDDAVLASVISPLLRQAASGTASPSLLDCLRSTPCIPTQKGKVRLRPAECFDPRNSTLRAMLGDSAAFPATALIGGDATGEFNQEVLDGLVALGMRVRIDKDALLQVARQLHSEFISFSENSDADEKTNSSSLESASKLLAERGAALLAALDDVSGAENKNEKEESVDEDTSYWSSLLDLSFLPVLTEPPMKGLPWSFHGTSTSFSLAPPLASPRKVRPQSAAWLVSASLNLLDGQCSEALQKKFRWTAPLPGKVLAAQLVALGHLHSRERRQIEENTDEALTEVIARAATQIYAQLENQFSLAAKENLEQQQKAAEDSDATATYNSIIVVSLLSTGPTIWVGDGFVSPSLVAFHTPTDLTPFIFSADEVLSSENLVKALNIPATPTAEQYLKALATMAAENENQPLDPDSMLLTALALVDGLGGELLAPQSSPRRLLEKYPGYLPDTSGVLAPASTLMYNDAPWLAHQEDQKMVHPDVAAEIATALGAQSLRYHHQVENQTSERLPCPPASLLKQLLTAQADPALLALSDILEIADAVGCRHVEIHLDARTHPSQSLLQSGLSAFQGPALCIKLGGVVLSADELCRLQSPPSNYRLRQSTCTFGCGLLVSYMLTDVIQVISGDSFYIFDPSATHLAMDSTGSVEESTGNRPGSASSYTGGGSTGHAKQYRHAGTDLPRRFADQFSVWDWAGKEGADVSSAINATLLRLPLRTAVLAASDAALSKTNWTSETVLELINSFASTISQTLLFAEHLQSISISHQGVGGKNAPAVNNDDVILIKEARIKLPVPTVRATSPSSSSGQQISLHRSWCEEKEWRRSVKSTSATGFLGNLSALSNKFSWLGGGGGGNNNRDPRAASPKKGKEDTITETGVSRFTQHAILARSHRSSSSSSPRDDGTAATDGTSKLIVAEQEEHWMVSVCAGGYSSGDIAADKRYTHHNFNPQAAVAVRIDATHPSKPALVPSPGLLVTWPLQEKQNLINAAENSLFGLPFSVSAFFALARSGGRRLLAPAAAAAAPTFAVEASPSSSSQDASDLLGSPRETTEHVKARFNAALLKLTGHATAILLEKVVLQNQHAECRALYSLLPLHIESPATANSDVALVCSQLCAVVARKRMWKLRRGDIVNLSQGCVMMMQQPGAASVAGNGVGDLSEAARNFMQARLPLFDVLDGVKPWLEAWGVEGIRSVSPKTVRQELKAQAVSGALAQSGAFSAAVAAELLLFATSDVLPPANTNTNTQEEGGEETAAGSATPAVVNLDALRDCKGLPCVDMIGTIQLFGSKTFLLVPSATGSAEAVALDPTTRLFASEPSVLSDFLHPELANYLSPLLAHPSIASTLQVEPYSLIHLSKHLSQVLPSHWAPVGMAADAPLAVSWRDGAKGGPKGADFFLKLWSFLHVWRAFAQQQSSSGTGGNTSATWIDPLAGWAILPSCNGDMVRISFRHLVVTPPLASASSSEVVNLMDEDVAALPKYAEPWNSKLVPALLETKMFVLDPRFAALASDICNASYEDNANFGNEEAMLFAKLKAASDVGQLEWTGLSPSRRETFLSWLAEQATLADIRTRIRSAELEMLQNAPIYPTLASSQGAHGRAAAPAVALLDSIDGAVASDVIAAVLGSPEAAPRALQQRLLQYSPAWDALYRVLDVTILDSPALLAAVMQQPQGFKSLPPTAQESCLDMIERDWHLLQERDICILALANAEFVTTAEEGKLATPKALYDPTLPLLATIFAGRAVFPHGKFASSQWISVLRSLGLKRSLDRPTVLEAARNVERRAKDEVQKRISSSSNGIVIDSRQGLFVLAEPGQQLSQSAKQVWDAASAVADHLAGEGSDLLLGNEGRELAENLRNIAFVPAKMFYLGRAAGAPTLAKYTDIVLPGDAPLAWTVAPVLDMAAAAPPLPIVHASLRIKSPPPFSSVVDHLKNISNGGKTTSSSADGGSSINAWPFPDSTPQSAFERVLLYLESEGLSANQLDQLRGGLALIPVANGTRVVKSSSVFVRLPVDAAPLLYELPPEFVSGLSILKKLGVSDAPSASDLLSALQRLPLGSRLSTPYTHAVARILNYLLVETSAPEALAAASRGEIPVLDAYSTVTLPLNCVWGDAGAWMGLIPRLAAAGGVSVAHPVFTPSLCKKLRISSVAHVVQERLDFSDTASLTPVAQIQGISPNQISARLQEPCVAEAVHAALEAQHRWAAALAPGLSDASVSSLAEITITLHTTGVEFVKTCKTVLALVQKNKVSPSLSQESDAFNANNSSSNDVVILPESSSSVASFASSDGPHRLIIAAEPHVDLSAALAAGITKMFKAHMMLPVAPLFAAESEILPATAGLLSRGDITTTGAGTSASGSEKGINLVENDSGLLAVTTAGELGALLTPQDAQAVKLHPLRRFSARELVAVRMPTGQLRYARVAANCAPPPGAAAFKVTLELSQGRFQDVLSPEILSFSGDIEERKEESINRVSTTVLDSRNQEEFGGFIGEGDTATANISSSSALQEKSENKRSTATTSTAASAPEVIAAVRSMLESAGMTMENDTSVLMEQTLVLQQRLATTQSSLDSAVVEKQAAEAAATHLKTVWQCRICLTREVDSAMAGCGHMLCSSCAEQLPRPECPFCRKRSAVTRLYR